MRTPPAVLVLAALAMGCSEYEVKGDTGCDHLLTWYLDADGDGYASGDVTARACLAPEGYVDVLGDCDDGDDAVHPEAEEVCNGLDDDCDAEVDEGHLDSDGDGLADCIDDACAVSVGLAGEVDIHPECEPDEPLVTFYPWQHDIEWTYCPEEGSRAITMPLVGHMDDDNGDGEAGSGDVPEVVVLANLDEGGSLVVLAGDTGMVRSSVEAQDYAWCGLHYACTPTLADVDGDGDAEAVGVFDVRGTAMGSAGAWNHRLLAIDADGLLWESPAEGLEEYWPELDQRWSDTCVLTASDLDGDGSVEIVADWGIYDGATGKREADLFVRDRESSLAIPTVADLDLDGTQEILLGEVVYDHTGEPLWEVSTVGSFLGLGGVYGNVAMPAQLDGDAEAEVLAFHDLSMSAWDTDGTWLWETALPGGARVHIPPCMADFDGDGAPELGVVDWLTVSVIELDGTLLWSVPTSHAGGSDGCTGADLDGDGDAELLNTSTQQLEVFDGASGTVLFTETAEPVGGSWSINFPVVADVDGDGTSEILVTTERTTSCETAGLLVLGNRYRGWYGEDQVWGIIDQADGKQLPDGSVPSGDWWNDTFRAHRAVVPFRGSWDLELELVDTCIASCEHGPLRLSWQVSNHGAVASPEGVLVQLWDSEELVDQTQLPSVDAGRSLAGQIFEAAPRSARQSLSLRLVDEESDCDEDDAVITWVVDCP